MASSVPNLEMYLARRSDFVRTAANIGGDRADAEDVVQEAWIRLASESRLRALERPAGYLQRIVRNLALDRRRRRSIEGRHGLDIADCDAEQIPSEVPGADRAIAAREELRAVCETLAALPDRVRIAVEMHRLDGARLADIAIHLGVSTTVAHGLVAQGIDACRRRVRDLR